MGCVASTGGSSGDDESLMQSKRVNDLIEQNLQLERNKNKNEVKLLLLGAGESGKSTVLKQMKLLHQGGFTHRERMQYGQVIWADAIESMRTLILQARKLGIELDSDQEKAGGELRKSKEIILRANTLDQVDARMAGGSEFLNEYVLKYSNGAAAGAHGKQRKQQQQQSDKDDEDGLLLTEKYGNEELEDMELELDMDLKPIDQTTNEEIAHAIKQLWTHDRGIRQCFHRSSEFQLEGSASYYFDNIEKFARVDYVCDDMDILKGRIKTTGITESSFKIGPSTVKVYDAGGQRSERRKWIHCFEGITAVIFVIAVSEYDQMLFEDERVNRMHESIMLLDTLLNSRWFANTPFILFLNKVDLFQEKVKRSPIRTWFPNYPGRLGDSETGLKYFESLLLSLNRNNKPMYVHRTCATDTQSMRFVLGAVTDLVIQQNLKKSGML
ncbi:guanine nucleotide-binding protein alpha-1 subunit [Kluyveromyces marxianus]|uniref:Guanine nucleotide-binding protein alpha-1 subunit n=2 Tax=Kluyveromyces marxianus TaxID=4911 RepID=W0TF76_KLUMD|nr:guanine nucleotide-binding protein alpha-1 subunit [Kluyveromyces marxianus DMKU3-1042]QGN17395.1 guanine nucleotide-binding protein alpha-1 subunit [Kluyveromyces marxianus]BAO41456.1 guanine nucleotide-binding protein alpha-1 subunit [Kluyveromyces marxianus DMKU3-1042]